MSALLDFLIRAHEENTTGATVSEGCSRRYLTTQNLQEFSILSLSAQLLVQTVSSQGWAHKARSVMSRSPGTEALGAGTKGSLSLPCIGILAINPGNCSLALSWALGVGQGAAGLAGGCLCWGCTGTGRGQSPTGKCQRNGKLACCQEKGEKSFGFLH